MLIIAMLLVVSLLVALFFLGAFIWNVKTGQYDDDFSPSHRIFFEDELKKTIIDKNNKKQ